MAIKLAAIVAVLAAEFDARLLGDANLLIEGLSSLEQATSRQLTFLSHPKYIAQLAHSSAACVVVAPAFESAAIERGSVGERCIIHPGVVVGADGFGFAAHQGRWEKIEQLGAVRIGNDVEIGANTCIDRGAMQDTVIEDGVKLDNLIQIGHNVHIGAHSALAGCVGVAGSARIGAHCTLGGGAVVLGHLTLADHVHISAASVVTRSILKPGNYTGLFPIDDNAKWEKNAASLKQLSALRERLKQLEIQLKNLLASIEDKS